MLSVAIRCPTGSARWTRPGVETFQDEASLVLRAGLQNKLSEIAAEQHKEALISGHTPEGLKECHQLRCNHDGLELDSHMTAIASIGTTSIYGRVKSVCVNEYLCNSISLAHAD